ncbi:MAG: hypothetical protein A2231_11405 [Candidatus Firestonebacteria bacterium RIFOXYA2_FULL_40_8]|nr:MAG: hypothetical protein A2231_11405 [Candidatus Firestonebacteria bacterium RIFOXYA2_FULL_40_8]
MTTIQLETYGVRVELQDENNKKQYRYLSPTRFKEIVLRETKFDSGLLPSGTLSYQRTGSGEKIALLRPDQIVKVKYLNNKADGAPVVFDFQVPLPPLLWIYEVNSSRQLFSTKVFAIMKEGVIDNTMLYKAPFSNVHPNGEVCWGTAGNLIDKPFKSLSGLSSLPRIFFLCPFNEDLFNDGNGTRMLNWFKAYDGKQEFPYSELKPYGIYSEVLNGKVNR